MTWSLALVLALRLNVREQGIIIYIADDNFYFQFHMNVCSQITQPRAYSRCRYSRLGRRAQINGIYGNTDACKAAVSGNC